MKISPTPTAVSAAISGAGLWALAWLFLLHVNHVARMFRLEGYVNTDKLLDWMTEHKLSGLLVSETLNFAKSGFGTDPMGVTFSLGGTVVNVFVLWCVLPARKMWRKARGVWTQ